MPFQDQHQGSFTFMTDANGAFTSLSSAIFYVLGYTPAELLGKSFATIATRDSSERSSVIMFEMLYARNPFEGAEIGLACKDGRAVEAEISGRPVMERGMFRGYQGVVLAVSEYQPPRITEGWAGSQGELLLDLVCHDINNMNQIEAGYIEFAKLSLSPGSEACEYIEKCQAIIESSSVLIRNVQKLQQISTGPRTLEKVDVGRVMKETVSQYVNLRDRNVTINYVQAGECFVMANGLLKDAFLNIIGNAIKHSTGPPVIDIKFEEINDEGKTLCLVTIDDNGPGIPDDMKARLFNRLEPGLAPTSGKGLGLYLVRKLVEGFGGEVWAEDRVPGDYRKGSRFVIALPSANTYETNRHEPADDRYHGQV